MTARRDRYFVVVEIHDMHNDADERFGRQVSQRVVADFATLAEATRYTRRMDGAITALDSDPFANIG